MPKVTRRTLAPAVAVMLLTLCVDSQAQNADLTPLVNPFIGTQAAPNTLEGGNTTPAAMVPFGMVQFGPDTTTAAGGYRFNHTTIREFSLTRYSGRAFATWLDVGLMPFVGFTSSMPSPGTNWTNYSQAFTHGSPAEVARPGFYHVHLDTKNIDVDLTATARTGFARMTFPAVTNSNILIQASPSANGSGAIVASGTSITLDAANRMATGSVDNNGSVHYRVFFAIKFDRPWTGNGVWNGATVTANGTASGNGQATGAWVNFDTSSNRVVQAKIGISYVSIANARDNLARENDPSTFAAPFDFTTISNNANTTWNDRLNQIQVTGGTTNRRTTFYTALYHSFMHPNIFSDANGQYFGFDSAVHTVNPGHAAQYHNIPGWDHSRTQSAFLAFMAPEEAADIADSLANDAKQDAQPSCLPRWQQGANDSRGMIGDGGSIVAANIRAYGNTNYDGQALLDAMYRGATNVNAKSKGHTCREGLSSYLANGFVSTSTGGGAGSITLEYVHTDFAIAQFAQSLGDMAKRDELMTRAQNWKKLWKADAAAPSGFSYTGYLVPRTSTGAFATGWSSTISGPSQDAWWREGNGSQYLWMVEHDRGGLIQLLGGNATAITRLQDHFGRPTDTNAKTKLNALIENTMNAYLGNEVEQLSPHMYAWASAPNKGAEVWRRMLLNWYPNAPNGSPANDDGGSMGSWVVMASLGLNHAIPGIGGFVVGSPWFTSATVRLPGGHFLDINAPNASDTNIYVQSLNWNGAAYNSPWLPWSMVKDGGTLDFNLSTNAASTWGTDPAQAPPSFGSGNDSTIQYETESLAVAATSGDVHRVASDAGYSAGLGTILEGNAAADFVSYTVNVPVARTYDIRVRLKRLTNRGIWQFASNGVNHGAPVDGFASSAAFAEVDIGNVTFGSAGNKTFSFTLTGKNASSTSFWIALDYIKLVPVGTASPTKAGADAAAAEAVAAADVPLTQFVNPFIGTERAPDAPVEAGNTTPAALVPFGMVQFGPDTTTSSGGYRFNHSTIMSFSLTRFSGRAISCWLDAGLMPTTGFTPGTSPSPGSSWSSYTQPFSHGSPNEVAAAGFYHVRLSPGTANPIDVDLTATARTGFARFTYPSVTNATLLVNAGNSANGNVAGGTMISSVDAANRMITGSAQSTGCGAGSAFSYRMFFAIQFDRAWTSSGIWNGGTVTPGGTASGTGSEPGAWVTFNTSSNRMVQAKVGISFTSIANAKDNLVRENPNSFTAPNDFDSVRASADAAWNARLNQVQVAGGTTDQKTAFYTALYHTHIHPGLFSDANGQYVGFDGVTRSVAAGRAQYHGFPAWDQHRTQMPFLALFAPNEAADMMESLANMVKSDNSGTSICLPRWQQANGDTRGMIGDGQGAGVANMFAYGVTNFDTATVKQAMLKGASDPNAKSDGHTCRENMSAYLASGWVPGSASMTLEYAMADFGLSRFAALLGDTATRDTYQNQANNWKKVWNPNAPSPTGFAYQGWISPRNADGTWPSFSASQTSGFTEGSAAQYVWMVPQNRKSLITMMGGNATALQRLNDHFGTTKAHLNSVYASTRAMLSNEPSELHPATYAYVGAPAKGAEVWRRLFLEWYVNPISLVRPSVAIPGNDDAGSLASQQVFSTIGLNHAVTGVAGFVIGSPLFPSTTLRLPSGTLQINAPAASATSLYVQSLNLNGSAYNSAWLPWSAVQNGGTLDFTLSTNANSTWGTDTSISPPPSFDNVGGTIQYEAETLPVAAFTAGRTERVASDTGYSGGQGVILEGQAVGDFVSFTVNVPEARTYDVRVRLKKLTNRGIWQFDSNGVNHGAPVDGFAATASFPEVDLGNVTFASSGNKTFRFTITGKNGSSTAFWIALDYVRLIPQ
jgi:predicted alpha-1,2-mannosidase